MKGNYRLTKQQLLRKNKNFQFVYRVGKSYANRFIVLYVVKNSLAQTRLGVVTGKRLGGAVVRNRIKRLGKEVFRLHKHRISAGYDLVLIGRAPVCQASYNQLAKAFLDLCKKAKILLS